MSPLAGHLLAQPGRGLPALQSTRRPLAARVARGRDADTLPDLLAAVFALCGGAHRTASRAALRAARGQAGDDSPQAAVDARTLQWDTIREHLRRLWLDWPRQLTARLDRGPTTASGPFDAAVLAACPALAPDGAEPDPAIRASRTASWAAAHVYGTAPADWLAGWQRNPARWLATWTEQASTAPARQLRACRSTALGLTGRPLPLSVHASPTELARLGDRLAADPGFAERPVWRGRCAETGPWTRLDDPLTFADARGQHPIANAWLRLGARLADLARLLLPDAPRTAGAGWLRHGALPLSPGTGIAYCEMARGLLIHWVRLDADDPSRVADCRVLAPTEWNFHPHGGVAQVLALLPPQVHPSTVRVLGAAYDPCVELHLAAPPGVAAPAANDPEVDGA